MKLVKTGVRIEISKATNWGKLWSDFWLCQHPPSAPPSLFCPTAVVLAFPSGPGGVRGSGNTPGYSDWWLVGRLTRNSRPPAQCCNADERWAAAPEGPPCCVSLPPFLCPQSPLLPHIGVWGWAGPAAPPAKRCSQPGMTWQWAPASGGAAAGSPMQTPPALALHRLPLPFSRSLRTMVMPLGPPDRQRSEEWGAAGTCLLAGSPGGTAAAPPLTPLLGGQAPGAGLLPQHSLGNSGILVQTAGAGSSCMGCWEGDPVQGSGVRRSCRRCARGTCCQAQWVDLGCWTPTSTLLGDA